MSNLQSYDAGGKAPRVLVVGLDGATLDVIDPMIRDGKLPNLAKIGVQGIESRLRSTILPLSPPAWMSFATGKNPGSHGIYDFAVRQEGAYSSRPTTFADARSKTIWDLVGEYGGKSIVVNMPLTYPPKRLAGVMITGFPTPVNREDYTYPRELLQTLKSRFGSVAIHKPKILYRKGREREITEETNKITRLQTEITKFLMEETNDWRFTLSVYDATDVIGHYFWSYLDPNHPKYDRRLAGEVRRMVEEVHIELDRAVGELLESVGPETLKLVISDHGFGPVYYGVYVNNWLLSKGYMAFKSEPKVRAKYFAFRHGLNVYNLLRVARRLRLVKSIESAYAARSFAMRVLNLISLNFDDVDWTKTRVYSAGNLGQLYINQVGREPRGIVSPQDAKAIVDELVSELKELRDPSTNELMFNMVYPGYEIFRGPANEDAPDVVFLDERMKYAAHRMFELGSNKLVTPHPIYSGNHKMDGILFATGSALAREGPGTPFSPNLIDLAPTILWYLGYPLDQHMEGRVLKEMFSPELVEASAASFQKSDKEQEKIKESISKRLAVNKRAI